MYTREGDTVTLKMTIEEWESLLIALGFAIGAANKAADKQAFWHFVRLANSLNNNNPDWTPYQIPAEFAGGAA